jgi:hypothetical protein
LRSFALSPLNEEYLDFFACSSASSLSRSNGFQFSKALNALLSQKIVDAYNQICILYVNSHQLTLSFNLFQDLFSNNGIGADSGSMPFHGKYALTSVYLLST